LLLKRKRRFQDLRRSEERIASNTLAGRLRALEAAGILERHAASRNEGGVTYLPTERGIDLPPVLVEITLWSAR